LECSKVEMAIAKRIYAMRYALCALRGSVYGHESRARFFALRLTIKIFTLCALCYAVCRFCLKAEGRSSNLKARGPILKRPVR
jgi:hypothetical protein